MTNLNFTDEELAAYLDKNISGDKAQQIENALSSNTELRELFDISNDIRFENNLGMMDVGMTNLTDLLNNILGTTMDNSVYEASGIVGDVVNPILQTYSDTCAIKSQQIILNEFGVEVTEDQLVQFSYENGWYHGDGSGTTMGDIGNLLEAANIPCTRQVDANVFNLVNELSQGHKVIVGVDSTELWGNSKILSWLKDFFMGDTPDHALIVAGLDTSDPNNIMVIVDDPGTGDYHKAYPLSQFMDSWSDAQCYMVSTDIAVPSVAAGMQNFDYALGHIPSVAGLDYSDFQIFNDLSCGLQPNLFIDGTLVSPTSSLMDAYFDVVNNNGHDFSNVFSDHYLFSSYLDTDIATKMMQQTFADNVNQINFQDISDGIDFSQITDNNAYGDFLNGAINDFNNLNDIESASLCEQQQMMLEYCNYHNIDFCSTFLS